MMASLSGLGDRGQRTARVASGTMASLAIASAAVALVGFSNTDRVLETSFSSALAGKDVTRIAAAAHTGSRVASVSGSEDYWLGQLPSGARPAAWSSPLSVGDRFAMGAEGSERRFTVVGVRETAVSVGSEGKAARLLLVECRDESQGRDAPTVRLIMDDGLAASLKAGAALPRTL